MNDEIRYPYIVFKIGGALYCTSSRYISTLVQLPEYSKIPAAPANVTGIFKYRDSVIQMLDLRTTLGMKSLVQEYEEFASMIDERKQDHINWVDALEKSSRTGEPFLLGRDPHQCKLGRWYDNFNTSNQTLLFHLKKIDEPHHKLHAAADEMENCKQECDTCKRDECLKVIMKRVREKNMPLILSLLDETKDVFRSTIYREMVLLLDGTKWGIVVDEVVSVEELETIDWHEQELMENQSSSYIHSVKRSDRHQEIIFELNIDTMFNELKELEAEL